MSAPALKFVAEGAANSMKAWVLKEAGDISKMAMETVEIPAVSPGHLRVKMAAVTTNPIDFKRAGLAGLATFPGVHGVDGAGTVDAVGAGAEGEWKVGDRVHFFNDFSKPFGSFAEYSIISAATAVRVNEKVGFDVAAVLPCAAWTAYEVLYDKMRVQKGDTIYIAAGAGGVGHFAIQMALNSGLRVAASASGDNVERLKKMGVECAIDYKTQSVATALKEWTNGAGVDCVFETVSAETALESASALKFGGQITHIVTSTPLLPDNGFFVTGITTHHVFIPGHHFHGEKEQRKFQRYGAEVQKLIESGVVKPDVSDVVGFDQIGATLAKQVAGHMRGKVLINVA